MNKVVIVLSVWSDYYMIRHFRSAAKFSADFIRVHAFMCVCVCIGETFRFEAFCRVSFGHVPRNPCTEWDQLRMKLFSALVKRLMGNSVKDSRKGLKPTVSARHICSRDQLLQTTLINAHRFSAGIRFTHYFKNAVLQPFVKIDIRSWAKDIELLLSLLKYGYFMRIIFWEFF